MPESIAPQTQKTGEPLVLKSELLADDFNSAIEKAGVHLPEGYAIHLQIEKGGFGVELEFPNGIREAMVSGDNLVSDLNDALCEANGFSD